MPYNVRPIPFDARDFSKHESLRRVAAFEKSADAAVRQEVIDYAIKVHALDGADTKSIVYAMSLDQPGKNVAGDIRIGPSAFEQDFAWLAGVVFHEMVHSSQYVYYGSKGVKQVDPKRSDIERRMIALDEYEAYLWTLKRSLPLALSVQQQAELRHRAGLMLIELDDETPKSLAKGEKFDAARDELIRQFTAKPAGQRTAMVRRAAASCCA